MTPVLFGTLAALLILLVAVPVARALRWRGKDGLSLGYKLYIRYSPVWKWKSRQCLRRAGGICRCGGAATQAHHLTYKRLYHERKDDLVALCATCHVRAHGRTR